MGPEPFQRLTLKELSSFELSYASLEGITRKAVCM